MKTKSAGFLPLLSALVVVAFLALPATATSLETALLALPGEEQSEEGAPLYAPSHPSMWTKRAKLLSSPFVQPSLAGDLCAARVGSLQRASHPGEHPGERRRQAREAFILAHNTKTPTVPYLAALSGLLVVGVRRRTIS